MSDLKVVNQNDPIYLLYLNLLVGIDAVRQLEEASWNDTLQALGVTMGMILGSIPDDTNRADAVQLISQVIKANADRAARDLLLSDTVGSA